MEQTMTKDEWGKIVKRICDFYPRSNFMDKQDVFDAWYSLLEDLEFPAAMRAVENYAKENQYPPTIADIRQGYKVLWDDYKAFIRDCKDIYCIAADYYPGMDMELKNEGFEILRQKLSAYPHREWRKRLTDWERKAVAYVRDCEINHKDVKNFKDYVNEQTI